jgi:hypothetical protein
MQLSLPEGPASRDLPRRSRFGGAFEIFDGLAHFHAKTWRSRWCGISKLLELEARDLQVLIQFGTLHSRLGRRRSKMGTPVLKLGLDRTSKGSVRKRQIRVEPRARNCNQCVELIQIAPQLSGVLVPADFVSLA